MPHIALESIATRLSWAHTHIDLLKVRAQSFMESEPYSIVDEIERETGDRVWRVKVHKEVPQDLAFIAADAVHSLRSTLDHVAWALARLTTDTPSTRTGFPVCLKPTGEGRESFSTHRKTTLRDIPAEAVAAIEECQPYKRPNPKGAPLTMSPMWALHEYWIRDKHHTVPIVPIVSRRSRISTGLRITPAFKGEDAAPRPTFGPIEDGNEVYRLPAGVELQGETEIIVAYEIAVDRAVIGPEAVPLYAFLRKAHDVIRDEVLPKFARDFPVP